MVLALIGDFALMCDQLTAPVLDGKSEDLIQGVSK